MARPMLAITDKAADGKASTAPARTTANLLPCRIHHDGPVAGAADFWQPQPDPTDAQKQTAYFRGRKLHATTVALPAGYRGVVAVRRDSPREAAASSDVLDVVDVDATRAEQAAQQQALDTGALAVTAEFGELVVWGHQSTADAETDPYVRALDEWVALSEKIHAYE